MSEELKPCPFCGATAEQVQTDQRPPFYAIWCPKCHVSTPKRTQPSAAAEIWNRREGSQAETDRLISSPANAAHLARSIEQARNGQVQERQLVEVEESAAELHALFSNPVAITSNPTVLSSNPARSTTEHDLPAGGHQAPEK